LPKTSREKKSNKNERRIGYFLQGGLDKPSPYSKGTAREKLPALFY